MLFVLFGLVFQEIPFREMQHIFLSRRLKYYLLLASELAAAAASSGGAAFAVINRDFFDFERQFLLFYLICE